MKEKDFKQIQNGERHFEYRKSFKKFEGCIKAYIYVYQPVAKIYSYVILQEGIYDSISNILNKIVSKDQPAMVDEVRDCLQGQDKNEKFGIALPIAQYKEFKPQDLSFLQRRFAFQPSETWVEAEDLPELFGYLSNISVGAY